MSESVRISNEEMERLLGLDEIAEGDVIDVVWDNISSEWLIYVGPEAL